MWSYFDRVVRRVSGTRAGSARSRYRPAFDALEDRWLPSLSAPTLVAPSGPIMNTTPTFTWNAVNGADFYVIKVQDTTGHTWQVAGSNHVTGTSFTPAMPLVLGNSYTWQVQADSNSGAKSALSASDSFTEINPFAGAYAGNFQGSVTDKGQTIPVNGGVAFTLGDNGKVTVTTPDTGIGTVNSAGLVHCSASGTGAFGKETYTFTGSVDVAGGNASASGTWTVTFTGGRGSGTWSAAAPAAQLVGSPLDSVVAVGPSGTTSATAPLFSWSPVAHADYYAVTVVDVAAGGAKFLSNGDVTTTSIPSPKLLVLGHEYSWSVTAFSDDGVTSGVTTTSFVIGSPFAGTYAVTYTGTADVKEDGKTVQEPVSGTIDAAVGSNASITVANPATGTGAVDLFGAAQLTAQIPGGLGKVSFAGTFDVAAGAASASGSWTAVIKGGVASGTWSAAATQLAAAPLDTPTTVQPAGSTASVDPECQWNTVANADFYVISVDDLTTHKTQVVVDTHVTGTSFTPATPLTLGDTYQWEVQADTNGDNASAFSAPTKFTVILAAPQGTTPTGSVQTATPTFTWSTVTNAASYNLQLNDVTDGGNKQVLLKSSIDGTSYTPTVPLIVGHYYAWTVRARGSNGTLSAWSTAVDFSVAPLAKPALNATSDFIEDTTPNLSWNSVTNANAYVVTLQDVTASSPKTIASVHVNGLGFTPSTPLTPGHIYQWLVQALGANGEASAATNALKFTLIDPFAGTYSGSFTGRTTGLLGQPISANFELTVSNTDLITLSNNAGLTAQGTMNLLGGINVTGSEQVEVFGSEVTVTFTLTGTGTIANGVATASGTFQGSADGMSATGTWTVSQTTLTGAPLDTPVLVGPSGPAISTTPMFSWNTVSGATGYALVLIDLSAKSSTVAVANDVTNTFTPTTPLKVGHEYEWLLVAYDAAGDASGQASDTFTVS